MNAIIFMKSLFKNKLHRNPSKSIFFLFFFFFFFFSVLMEILIQFKWVKIFIKIISYGFWCKFWCICAALKRYESNFFTKLAIHWSTFFRPSKKKIFFHDRFLSIFEKILLLTPKMLRYPLCSVENRFRQPFFTKQRRFEL